ncbi:MAG: KH domain-containing protein [Syntrophobacteraceae bacterium]
MKVEFYRLFPFLPTRIGKIPYSKWGRNRPYTDGISIRKCARQDELKLNAFQLDQQRIVQGEIMLKELIGTMARALVDNPEQVKVSEIEGGTTSIIELRVAKSDLGKVIGKQGHNADAMRTILSAASMKIHKRAILEIIG